MWRDRWKGQAMSEEVKQKQAEDCFLSLSPPLSGDPAGQCFVPGCNLSVQGEGTVHLQMFCAKCLVKLRNVHQHMTEMHKPQYWLSVPVVWALQF